jgi:hypothetical protein
MNPVRKSLSVTNALFPPGQFFGLALGGSVLSRRSERLDEALKTSGVCLTAPGDLASRKQACRLARTWAVWKIECDVTGLKQPPEVPAGEVLLDPATEAEEGASWPGHRH